MVVAVLMVGPLVGDGRVPSSGESLGVAWPLRLTWTIGYAVPALAGVAAPAGSPLAAAMLFGAAATWGPRPRLTRSPPRRGRPPHPHWSHT